MGWLEGTSPAMSAYIARHPNAVANLDHAKEMAHLTSLRDLHSQPTPSGETP